MDFHMVELLYLILCFFIWSVKEIHEVPLRVMTQPTHGRRQSWPRRMASMVGSFLGSGPGRCGTKQDPGVGLYRPQESQYIVAMILSYRADVYCMEDR